MAVGPIMAMTFSGHKSIVFPKPVKIDSFPKAGDDRVEPISNLHIPFFSVGLRPDFARLSWSLSGFLLEFSN